MGDWSAIYIRMDLGAAPAAAAWGFAAFSLTMAIGRLSGDRPGGALSAAAAILVAGAVIGAATLGVALLAGHPAAAVIGFAGMGLGLANIAPIVFSAAGRLPELAPGIGIAAVSTAGYCGFLAGPPLIGLVAEASGLPVGLGLVALVVGFMILGTGALQHRPAAALAPADNLDGDRKPSHRQGAGRCLQLGGRPPACSDRRVRARAALATGTFAITSPFLITGQSWQASLGGFPALSPPGGSIVKDRERCSASPCASRRMLSGIEPWAPPAGLTEHRNHKKTAFQHSSPPWQVVTIGRSINAKCLQVDGVICMRGPTADRPLPGPQIKEASDAC